MRVLSRNKTTREDVLARISNQMSDTELASRADYIVNNAENEMVIPQILAIHNEILESINEMTNG